MPRPSSLLAAAPLAIALLLCAAGAPVLAQTEAGSQAEAVAAPSADQLLAPGLKSLKAGKADAAVKAFSSALGTKGLGNADLSRIYYYRGLAYLKSKKSAQAIADLTNALWLKGLSPEEAAEALRSRGLAYEAAGLKDRAKADLEAAAQAGATGAEPGVTAASTADQGEAAAGQTDVADAGWSTEVNAPASGGATGKSATTTVATQTGSSGGASTWETNVSASSSAPSVSFAGSDAAANTPAPAADTSTLGGFFSSLFTGGSGAPSPSAKSREGAVADVTPRKSPETTASISPAAPTAAAADAGWDQVEVAAATGAQEPSPSAGTFSLQLASLRSPEEAQSFISEVQSEHGEIVGSTGLSIAEATLGNMGRFYQVRMGPFADERSTLKACNLLQRKGIDCFMVTQ